MFDCCNFTRKYTHLQISTLEATFLIRKAPWWILSYIGLSHATGYNKQTGN